MTTFSFSKSLMVAMTALLLAGSAASSVAAFDIACCGGGGGDDEGGAFEQFVDDCRDAGGYLIRAGECFDREGNRLML
ncbi:hypothetical protein HKCCE3408_17640 [Rhodobacterales bacterium HKCCE3408]|nr:hypothetical protein [Rhodobacterales bacterium HKCCE3408]